MLLSVLHLEAMAAAVSTGPDAGLHKTWCLVAINDVK